MKLGIVLLLLISLNAFSASGGLEFLEIQDMNLTYIQPSGRGKIGKFKFGVDVGGDRKNYVEKRITDPGRGDDFLHDIDIKMINGDMFIESDYSYVVWRDAPSIFMNSQKIKMKNLDFFFTLSRNTVTADELIYHFTEAWFDFKKLDVMCSDKLRSGDIAQRLLENCLFNSHIKMDQLVFNFPKKVVRMVLEQTYPEEAPIRVPVDTIKDFDLTVVKSQVNADFKVRFLTDIKAHFSGKLKPLLDTQKLEINVQKIKLGVVNVTKLTLWILKKVNIHGVAIDTKNKKVTISF